MQPTAALSRILGIEKKNRVSSSVRIEKEFLDIFSEQKLEKSDTMNISVQRFCNIYGVPVLLVALEPDGARVRPLDMSDVINLSLSDMLQSKGMMKGF
ncbi:hypothetical protein F1737_09000 [Methanoplanus sp. FWC-SCC4]|uniref:Uncharacterized protein n=1 Tax=Methanochimaera problematica TaxID=2609417 RepID=A0AA97FE12_9EURY|nr:hypothetical protein [Methanoplanus sp. FWC-SCC4]WOF16817.1 hypothetical protein F1737_09000 [Methanoplanus sp. FWC-SCC4]